MFDMILGSPYGMWGAVIGCLLGLGGGVAGTYLSIKNTRGYAQRRFMIKAAVVTWISLALFLGLLIGLPFPYGFIMWVPYGIFLPMGITYMNRRLQQIAVRESLGK